MWYRVLTQYQFLMQDLDTGEVLTRQYGSVINACGHHWDPLWPELKGDYKGELSHAHAYRSPKPFEGKRVCIIGGGNSGTTCLPRQLSASPDFLFLDQLLITGASNFTLSMGVSSAVLSNVLAEGLHMLWHTEVKCQILQAPATQQASGALTGMSVDCRDGHCERGGAERSDPDAAVLQAAGARGAALHLREAGRRAAEALVQPLHLRAVSFSCNRRKESSADITSCKALGACCRL